MNKKFDHVISAVLRDTQAYDSYFNKVNHFSLTVNFLTPKDLDLHCSHDIMLRTQTLTINLSNPTIRLTHHHETYITDFNLITQNRLHHSFYPLLPNTLKWTNKHLDQ